MKKTFFLSCLVAIITTACKEAPSVLPGSYLYVDMSTNPVYISNLPYNSIHRVRDGDNHQPVQEWRFTGVYDIQGGDSLLIPSAAKNSCNTDTIRGDWFCIIRCKQYVGIIIDENDTGYSRKLRLQYTASTGIPGRDVVVEQNK